MMVIVFCILPDSDNECNFKEMHPVKHTPSTSVHVSVCAWEWSSCNMEE